MCPHTYYAASPLSMSAYLRQWGWLGWCGGRRFGGSGCRSGCSQYLYFCTSKASAFVLVKQGVLTGVAVEVGAFVAGVRRSEGVSIFTFVLVKQGQFCTSKASKHP